MLFSQINQRSFTGRSFFFKMEKNYPICYLYTSVPCFIAFHSMVFCRYCVFYRLKVCGNPTLSNPMGAIFPTAFAHLVCLCHILVILTIFQTFSL